MMFFRIGDEGVGGVVLGPCVSVTHFAIAAAFSVCVVCASGDTLTCLAVQLQLSFCLLPQHNHQQEFIDQQVGRWVQLG